MPTMKTFARVFNSILNSHPISTKDEIRYCTMRRNIFHQGMRKGMFNTRPFGARRSYVKIAREIGLHSASSSKRERWQFCTTLHSMLKRIGSFKDINI